MGAPRVISFHVEVLQTRGNDNKPAEVQKATFGVQPTDDAGFLIGRAYGIDLPNVATRIGQYANLFGQEYAQQAAADAATIEAILKRWGAIELAALNMSGADLPPLPGK